MRGGRGAIFCGMQKVITVIMAAVLSLALSSCQTVEKEVKEAVAAERKTPSALSVIRQWEEYMKIAMEDKAPSLDTILKLTDMYFDAKDLVYKEAMDAYENDLALYNQGRIDKEPRFPVKDYAELIRYFKPLTARHRAIKGWDTALYALGYVYAEQGLKDESIEVFEELVKGYPQSVYLVEVSFRLGEFYFENAMLAESIEAYSRILKYPNSNFYEKALYKLGWTYYKLDDLERSIDAFSEVMGMRRVERTGKGGLDEEATAGVVMSMNHYSDVREAVGYIKSKGLEEYMPTLLERLADVLTLEVRYEAAIYAYTTLAELFPDYTGLPFIYNQLADLYDRSGNASMAMDVRLSLLKRFNPQTPWYKENYPKPSQGIDEVLSEAMLSVAKIYHQRGKKEGSADDLRSAIEVYRLFLLSFPASPRYREVNLLYSEALFDSGAYKDAAREYEKIAALYPPGRERGEIANLAFLTDEIEFYRSAEDRGESLKAAEGVVGAFKDDLKTNDSLEKALYKLSDMYVHAGEFARARENITALLQGRGAASAHEKVAEIYLAEGNIAEAEETYANLVKMSGDASTREMLAKLRYRIAEDSFKEKRWEDAVKKFEEAAGTLPGSKVAESALVRLCRIYIERKEMNKFEDVLKRLDKAGPNPDILVALLVEAGRTIENESPVKAGEFYERASALSQKGEDSLKLLMAAGVLYEKAGQYDRAEDAFGRYAERRDAPEEKTVEALFMLGAAQIKAGKRRAGLKTLKDLVSSRGKAKGRFAAGAKLFLLNADLDEYLKVELTQPFEETLKKKTSLLEGLLMGYSALVDENVPELLPGIFSSMGMAFENFRDSILNSERPEDLSGEELEEYNFLLEEKAYPYDEQAVGAYENSLKSGIAQKLYDASAESALSRLAILRPALYKRQFEEEALGPVYMHEPASVEVAGGGGR